MRGWSVWDRRFLGPSCGRGAQGTVEGARRLRPREPRSARGGTRRECAGGTRRAVRVCACARRACPAVLKDTSGRRRRGRCPGDVTARPSDNRPVLERSADTRGGSGGSGGRGDSRIGAGPGEQELGARSVDPVDTRLAAGPRRSGTCLAPFSGFPRPSPPRAAARGAPGSRRAGGNWRRRGRRRERRRQRRLPPGLVITLGAGPGRTGQAASLGLPVFLSTNSSSAFSRARCARRGRARWVVKRDEFSSLSIKIRSFNRIRCALLGRHGQGARQGRQLRRSSRRPVGAVLRPSEPRGRRPGAHALTTPTPGIGLRDSRAPQLQERPEGRTWGPTLRRGKGRSVGSSESGADRDRTVR
ncbi:uncharacterized protein [Macaca fascicularis]|uniref:uncharacterized protein LOC114670570 n=1 Tax=Macaca mulatta TaxID=9544 RepID=UPI0010A24E74|nr:uncharacterized protein LOC114670570 [Macaca mulatta]